MIRLIEQITYIQPNGLEVILRRLFEEGSFIIERVVGNQVIEEIGGLDKDLILKHFNEWKVFERKIGSQKQ